MSVHRKAISFALVTLILLTGCASQQPGLNRIDSTHVSKTPDLSVADKSIRPLTRAENYIDGANMFKAQEALKHIEYLASDEMEGRLVGTPGNQMAGDYIAARFAEYGLQPAGIDDSYFQPFTTTVNLLVEQPVLSVYNPASDGSGNKTIERTYVAHNDFMPRTGAYMGSGDVTGQVVVFPYCNPADMTENYAGRIILCNVKPGFAPPLFIEKMLEYKAAGFLLIYDQGPYPRSGNGIGELIDMPAFRISPSVTNDILAGSGYSLENLDQLKAPLLLATHVRMDASYQFNMAKTRNVLGLLPGSDPEHSDEIVIIGAHYDHVGCDPDGTIYNGANDNASGVAVMLEVARLWQAQGFHPARSVLFAAWDAEEEGYLGSVNYVSDPDNVLYHKTIAMLNLEMAGIGDTIFIAGESAMADQLKESANLFGFTMNSDPAGGSDDITFQDAGITAGMVSIDPDSYDQLLLHRPEDDARMIHLDSLRVVGILSAHALAAWSGGRPTLLQD